MKSLKTVLILLCCAAVAALGMLWLGGTAIRHPDADPDELRAGAVLSLLRDGNRFLLSEAYPEKWETARFVSSSAQLSRREQSALYRYDASYIAASNEPFVLLWRGNVLVSAFPMPEDRLGYPRFLDATGERSFSLSREEASFACTFVADQSGRGGYYECRAENGTAV